LDNFIKRILYPGFFILVMIIIFSSCTPQSPRPTTLPENTVFMVNDSFIPQTITVTPGTKITWVNMDTEVHSVTCQMSNEMEGVFFDSGAIEPGWTYERTFVNTGQFHYRCKFQPMGRMTGVVIVQ